MKGLIVLIAVCVLGKQADAWGGLFNRFSPEMLANMGYGGHSGFIQVSSWKIIDFVNANSSFLYF